ncbi:MAG: Fur family ferric uptake transcriptional regulator [Myxococcota bacterium]|jgi:Fur family ferric uptake transcriptional regulator
MSPSPGDDTLRAAIHDAGMRVTRARITVLRLLSHTDGPVSHADVTEALAGDGWDRATLYRNLMALTEAGLLRRVDMGDHVWRFERVTVRGDAHADDHPHFLCTACGDVACLPAVDLRMGGVDLPRALAAGQVSIQLRGLCDECITV